MEVKEMVFNLASATWHMAVVSKDSMFQRESHHEEVLHSETLHLLGRERKKKQNQMSFKVGQNATCFL